MRLPGLYVQVLLAILAGVLLGALWPELGTAMKPLGDAFIKLIRMLIGPIIFVTVTLGIAKVGDLRAVGRVGLKAFVYFEAVTTLAMVIGLVVVNLVRPGAGIGADPATLDAGSVAAYGARAEAGGVSDFLLAIIPDSFLGALAGGELLQVLLVAVLSGIALARGGSHAQGALEVMDRVGDFLFQIIALLMRLAPVGAFGAMAFTIGRYGIGTLAQLGALMASVYLTCALFIAVVLGLIARLAGFSLWAFLRYIGDELLIVLGTSSSETALPPLMAKLEKLGCARQVVGLVVPTGYSFNLDGTSIYLTMAAIFIAQAVGVDLSLGDQLALLAVLLVTSKGAAGVTGAGYVTLAATLSAVDTVPVAGIALILGVDRFMSEARAITNLIGNGVATIAIARWEGALDRETLARELRRGD
ncbi:C4-dicarboxylate transporter DctA [Sphingomonas changnyeongensis]|uniref:C4-dicarboxylate transporter DctA n=1 Tax=Sphingomonas changnyeongensis TaxID=2698679 RepID=A0A7Z2NWX7_9SPHN|nr:C4-dicarboxylate transporter DctA [Sphingomonas changnyeongensis]QHL91353.1 C4-dicarboxylate transporter DctA [Sphingomonas changnyeongensis]